MKIGTVLAVLVGGLAVHGAMVACSDDSGEAGANAGGGSAAAGARTVEVECESPGQGYFSYASVDVPGVPLEKLATTRAIGRFATPLGGDWDKYGQPVPTHAAATVLVAPERVVVFCEGSSFDADVAFDRVLFVLP